MFGFIGLIVFALIALTPFGEVLERSMTTHIVVEFPLLAFAGYLMAMPILERYKSQLKIINKGGIPGILIASFALAFWMIPKWLDYSLVNEGIAWAKMLSITMLIGIPLSLSWAYLHPVVAALLKIEFLTMLLRLGWIYLISPERLCNNYLVSDQIVLGKSFLFLATALALLWIVPLFIESNSTLRYSNHLVKK